MRVVCRPRPHDSPCLRCSAQSNKSSFHHSSFSFHHSSFPFILSFLSLPRPSHAAFQALPSGCPSRCWPPSRSPRVVFKHCPTTILHVTGTAPAAPKATGLLCIDRVARPHWPRAVAPRLKWATDNPCYCTDHVPTIISSFSFSNFPLFPSSTTFLPLCSLCLNYHSPSCH